jgi:hypothetical protein
MPSALKIINEKMFWVTEKMKVMLCTAEMFFMGESPLNTERS